MAVVGNLQTYEVNLRFAERVIKLTFSGSYVTGGDTLDLTALTNNFRIDGAKQFSKLPRASYSCSNPGGFYFEFIPGATLKLFKVKVYNPGGTELAAGAYPGGLTAPTSDPLVQFQEVMH